MQDGPSAQDGSGKAWFAPKRYGIGFSYPIAWQGWAVVAFLLACLFASRFVFSGVLRVLAIVAVIAAFFVIGLLKTEGGWRWRWGGN